MDGRVAIDALEAAFAGKVPVGADGPVAGVFGNGVPLAFVSAAGLLPIDVKSAPDDRIRHVEAILSPYLEPFLDDHARIFLHRLLAGDFSGIPAIVFPRDDAAALAAYQYALELRRQEVDRSSAPRLLLWNLVHGASAAIAAFNLRQAERLGNELAAIAGVRPAQEAVARAQAAELARTEALGRLQALASSDPPLVAGAEAFRWRNAGRYLAAESHAALLDAACIHAQRRPPRAARLRIGLVGTALDDPRVYEAIEAAGTIVCDLQPFGEIWPGPSGAASAEALLGAEASDPLAARARPELTPLDASVGRLVAARCDLVVAQYDQNDDSFGWDLPGLRQRLGARGIPLIDLGFRDHRPDERWLEGVRSRLAAAPEAIHA